MNKSGQFDKYIKYSLPLNKELIDWNSAYIRYGGKQLIEILEKEISINEIIERQSQLEINDSQIDRLVTFINEANASPMMLREIKGYSDLATSISFFYKGSGILSKLYKILDLTPVIENGKFESRFSFVSYELFENEFGYVVVSKINFENWSDFKIDPLQRSLIEDKYFFYNKKLESLADEEIKNNLLDAYKTLKILTD